MKRRVLSVMLAAALCLGLLPGRAEAADGLICLLAGQLFRAAALVRQI